MTDGNATVYVSDMSAAVRFYTDVLGMTVKCRYGDHWAEVQAGSFTIGLHPKEANIPEPGTHGAIQVGLNVLDIEAARSALMNGGAGNVGVVMRGSGGAFVHFHDQDGNALYLWQS